VTGPSSLIRTLAGFALAEKFRERFRGLSKLFAEKINKYGGKAQVLMLPDAGLKGNTHIPFADMNNVAVADLLSKFLAENGLDKR
jgi:hypothetical protein